MFESRACKAVYQRLALVNDDAFEPVAPIIAPTVMTSVIWSGKFSHYFTNKFSFLKPPFLVSKTSL